MNDLINRFNQGLLVLVVSALISVAQPSPVLTNQDIVDMSKAGLSAAVIISKIKTSKSAFKTEVADLKALADEKVADDVVAVMIERQAQANVPARPVDYRSENPEHGNLNELKGKMKVFLVVDDAPSRKVIADSLTKNFIQIVDRREDADFGLRFFLSRVDAGSNALLGTAHNIILVGELWAYTYLPVPEGSTQGRIRILWQQRKTQDWSGGLTFDRHPATSAVNAFVKDWKKIK